MEAEFDEKDIFWRRVAAGPRDISLTALHRPTGLLVVRHLKPKEKEEQVRKAMLYTLKHQAGRLLAGKAL